jgi:hypothetical protein
MPTATLTAPKTTDRGMDLLTLRNAVQAGRELCWTALRNLARKAGMEAHAHRLRYYGADWMDDSANKGWRAGEAVKALRDLERNIGRKLDMEERWAFNSTMIELMHDLV